MSRSKVQGRKPKNLKNKKTKPSKQAKIAKKITKKQVQKSNQQKLQNNKELPKQTSFKEDSYSASFSLENQEMEIPSVPAKQLKQTEEEMALKQKVEERRSLMNNILKLNIQEIQKLEIKNDIVDYLKVELPNTSLEENKKYIYTPIQLKQYKKMRNYLTTNKTFVYFEKNCQKNQQGMTKQKKMSRQMFVKKISFFITIHLVKRVIDGRILGKIPKCPNCLEGRLRFNNEDGTYLCLGSTDDEKHKKGDDIISCFKKFNMDEIKRESWKI